MLNSVRSIGRMGRKTAFLSLSNSRIRPISKICTSTCDFKSNNPLDNSTLPSLPVPPLSRTIVNFLLFSKVLQPDDNDYMETLEVCKNFVQSEEVNKLQVLLEERAKQLPNWLTPWWVIHAYLAARTPLPIFTSPGMTFPKLNFSGVNSQCEHAAKIIHAALSYHQIIISGQLSAEKSGSDLLDMSQYKLMFGTTRIPNQKLDIIQYGRDRIRWASHIIVTRNGNTFKVPVCNENGEIYSITQLQSQLLEVVKQSETRNEFPVNVISTNNRDVWADVYQRIIKSSPTAVKSVEDALFVLSLDSSVKSSKLPPSEANMSNALHGGGTDHNTCNRWFDKALQFCIDDEGYAGFTYEHTPAEGPPFAALIDFVQDQLTSESNDSNKNVDSRRVERIEKLEFVLTEEDKKIIQSSSKRIDKAIDDLEIKRLSFNHFGKNVPKSAKMSPDSFIQIAMQLAFYNIHSVHAPTYETASLRRFAQGRTETIRLPNISSVTFVENAQTASINQLKLLLAGAINAHKEYSNLAMNGKGMDRHLLGIKIMALEQKYTNLPELYLSKAYNKLSHFRLSTSQVPTRNVLPMGYGPSADDCYAVCYNPREKSIDFTITAFNNCSATSAQRYAEELEKALIRMKEIAITS